MPKRFCLGCRDLIDVEQGSRCPECQSDLDKRRDRKRGNRHQRGLGYDHVRAAREALAGAQVCVICGRPPTPTDPLQADHTVPRARGGADSPLRPVHRSYNASRGDGDSGQCAP